MAKKKIAEKTEFRIKFIPTGNIFALPKEEVIEILKNDRGNYEDLDNVFEAPVRVEETTTYNKVVEE